MSLISVKQFRVETHSHEQPLIAIGNLYVNTSRQPLIAGTGAVLLFAHGTGYRRFACSSRAYFLILLLLLKDKEIWEPTIKHIFSLDKDHIIHEAWAVNCQNHGESAALNEKTLVDHPGILGK